jgi:F420-non-reducing hydrogenase iron-sulfur subunit
MTLLKKMLVQMGVEDDRVRLEWISASEGERLATVVNDMTATVRQLGPFSADGGDGHGQA